MRTIIRAIIVIIPLLVIVGCASSGVMGVMSILSGADIVSQLTTGKNTVDNVVSKVSGKDCAVFRMFKGKKVCRKEETESLLDMDCDIYAWDKNDKPYCKK